MNSHALLQDLAVVLCTAAVVTVVFHRLRQPVVLGYVLAGMLVGPHASFGLVAGRETVETLSELGVILLMFSLGLEFSVRRLLNVLPRAGLSAVVEMGTMMVMGYTVAESLGLRPTESVFLAAAVAISSTMVVAKVLGNSGGPALRELVFGILVVEDLGAVLLLTVLTGVASGLSVTADALGNTLMRLGLFLVMVLSVGIFVVPRIMRSVVRLRQKETLLVASVGVCFALAGLAQQAGYSVALGAFMAGSLVAEGGASTAVERLVEPLRDMFGAIFFVSVGMLVDPRLAVEHAGLVVVLSLVVVMGKGAGVALGALLGGQSVPTAVKAGMTLGQIGEFSFIMVGIGAKAGVVRDFLFPVAVTVSALTSFVTPALIRSSTPAALWVDRHLPRPLQTVLALYSTWLGDMRGLRHSPRALRQVQWLSLLVTVDAALMLGVVVGTSMVWRDVVDRLETWTSQPRVALVALVITMAAVISTPLVYGLVSTSRRLALALAGVVFPAVEGTALDRAASPRRALLSVLHLGTVAAVGLPFMALAQPFLPPLGGPLLLGGPVILLMVLLWRDATNLQGHVRAGAQLVVELLGQTGAGKHEEPLHLDELLPGLGDMHTVRLKAASAGTGKSLAELNVRGLTGATVVALRRDGAAITPTAQDPLLEGDVLALMGSEEAVGTAVRLLTEGAPKPPPEEPT